MEPGSVVVDVAVDQGGCIETCRPTTHDNPTYEVDGVVHYCVAEHAGRRPADEHVGAHEHDDRRTRSRSPTSASSPPARPTAR